MENHTTYSVYRIVCFVTGKVYVGQTNDLKKRKRKHFNQLKLGNHPNHHLQYAYNKHGASAFFFEMLETRIHPDLLDDRERHWIMRFDSYANGFNLTSGGNSGKGESTSRPCEWNGTRYKSLSDAARANGILTEAMLYRVNRGYVCDNDMPRGNANAKPFTWEGVEYTSYHSAARALGVTPQCIEGRSNKGYSTNDDVQKARPRSSHRAKSCEWNGVEYRTIMEAAQAIGVSKSCMAKRVSRGCTSDEDLMDKSDSK